MLPAKPINISSTMVILKDLIGDLFFLVKKFFVLFPGVKKLVARAEENRFVKNESAEAAGVSSRQFEAALAVACIRER